MKRPTLTPSSLIKKVFRPAERSLPKNEVIARLEQSGLVGENEAARLVDEVLALPESPIRAGHSGAVIELTHKPHHLFDMAYRLLRDTHTPRATDHILREVRRQTNLSWNQATRMLVLERDPRFVRYIGDSRWFLAEWTVANDPLYQFAVESGIDRLTIRTLGYVLEQELGLSLKQTVFLPELDERFRVEGETLYMLIPPAVQEKAAPGEPVKEAAENPESPAEELFPETVHTTAPEATESDAPAAESDAPKAESDASATESDTFAAQPSEIAVNPLAEPDGRMEAAAAVALKTRHEQVTMEEEWSMNATNATHTLEKSPVLKDVEQLLQEAVKRLEARQQEMANEVVSYFQESNMPAIEALMKEKHQTEQVALGIRQVLSDMNGQ